MHSWWQRDVIEPGKLPLLVCFAAFVITFLTTRGITRAIRAGRGPFHNITEGGTHVHHAVPGIILLVSGAFLAVDSTPHTAAAVIAAAAVGIGTSLVLDEFALILHLQDDYWTAEGRVSVEMVSLAFGCLGFMLVGIAPFGVNNMGDAELSLRIGGDAAAALTLATIAICAFKGKFKLALFGIFVPPLAWIGAIRLARPTSRWAKRRYDSRRQERAEARAAAFDKRWDPILDRISNLIAGKPSSADPAAK
ncbi:MAG TPA: hypothetical protein VMF07_11910 [Solirubrobacteraceae bacterium]|nr:hypothetical protein [Solirubrobacteraceae bacterium]